MICFGTRPATLLAEALVVTPLDELWVIVLTALRPLYLLLPDRVLCKDLRCVGATKQLSLYSLTFYLPSKLPLGPVNTIRPAPLPTVCVMPTGPPDAARLYVELILLLTLATR